MTLVLGAGPIDERERARVRRESARKGLLINDAKESPGSIEKMNGFLANKQKERQKELDKLANSNTAKKNNLKPATRHHVDPLRRPAVSTKQKNLPNSLQGAALKTIIEQIKKAHRKLFNFTIVTNCF